METLKFDVAVIGAGSAGLRAAREAGRTGARSVLIEAGEYGTTCARDGCMPSKALIAAANAAESVRRASHFGVMAEFTGTDGTHVLRRVRELRERFVRSVVESVERIPKERRLKGYARFVSEQTLQIEGGPRVEADAIVVAVGSKPQIPKIYNDLGDRLLTNEDVFDLPELPKSTIVAGAGTIGLELGQALHRLGVKTTLLEPAPQLPVCKDPEVLDSATSILQGELDLHLGARVESCEAGQGNVRAQWKDESGQTYTTNAERVLVTAGRRPQLEGLELDKCGMQLDDRGVPVFDPQTLRCGEHRVFVAGDVTGARPVLHEAVDEGRIAGHNAAVCGGEEAFVRKTPLHIVFTDPGIARVGPALSELQREHERVGVGEVDFADQGRARVMGVNQGKLRVFGDPRTGRILGAELIAPSGEHLAHQLCWLVSLGQSVNRALDLPFYHPVIEEGLRTALRSLASDIRMRPVPIKADLDCGPGV